MIARPVVLRELASRDVDEAIAYYLTEADDRVALRFIDAMERACGHISRHPASGSLRYAVELNLPGLRAWPLRRFPHIVFYVETKDRLDVWRVLHAARDIPSWMPDTDSR